MDNSPVPLPRQRLAGALVAALDARGFRILGDRHIGRLIAALDDSDLPADAEVWEVLRAVDGFGADMPRGGPQNPFGWFVTQILDTAIEVNTARARRAADHPAPHRHVWRAMVSPTVRGCLHCAALKVIG